MYTFRLKQPLIITFSVIVICMFSLCAYHYLYVNAVRDKVRQAARKHELLWKMKDLQYVDEVLTNSVANSILTSDLSRLDAYEAAYRNFTALLNDINHLQAENEIPNIFNGNDSMTELIRSTERSVADLMRCGERDSALMVFKSPDYRQAKDTFRQQIKDCRNHYADGKESSSRKKKTVYRAFERQDLIFLLFVVLIAFLLLILARYLAKAFVQLRHAGTVAAEHNTEINRIKNELADVNSAYQLGNNALKKQTEALAKKDEALKEQGVALVNAQ